jgi:hypothetical protein
MMEELLAKIKSRGYWFVIIRPLRFKEERISSLEECSKLVRECQVSLRGWNYPHITDPKSGLNWVESSTDWECYKEYWRMYQSGQFVHLFGCREDWWSESSLSSPETREIKPGSVLSVLSTLFSITEIYEFAARLAEKNVFDHNLRLTIELHGMKNRKLTMLEPGRISRDYVCAINELPLSKTIPVEEILSQGHDLALKHTIWIFERFNWHSPPIKILKEEQNRLLEHRL